MFDAKVCNRIQFTVAVFLKDLFLLGIAEDIIDYSSDQ